ncbi:MAG: hypothetical protein KZQ80_14455 [Candidatus Thiodiazotropha sp. (ex Monitilora ramsayi)]|nr:hypothetical protein [Candidatus Thiodiazotropha sp. (ex Monitilora ramsayi)]
MDREAQILAVHAVFINQVVTIGPQTDRQDEFENLLKLASDSGWSSLVAAIRQIIHKGRRDLEVLNSLDEEDRIIAESILRGLQDPSTLPDPNAKPDPTMAAPGLAAMIHAAGSGNAQALQIIADMADQMSKVGGPMGKLAAVIRPMINGERDPDKLCKQMDSNTETMVMGILEELKQLEADNR